MIKIYQIFKKWLCKIANLLNLSTKNTIQDFNISYFNNGK